MKTVSHRWLSQEVWVLLGALGLAVACIWPLKQLRALPDKHLAVEQQLMQVQAMAAQAQQLRAQPRQTVANPAEQLQAIVASTLGQHARVSVAGDSATLALDQAQGPQLAQALESIRLGTGARFTAAHWTVQGERIQGRIELQLPAGQS